LLRQEGERHEGYIYMPRYTKDQLIARAIEALLADIRPKASERHQALAALSI
jgi:hypothetical protein